MPKRKVQQTGETKVRKEEFEGNKTFQEFQEAGKKCWKGYEKKEPRLYSVKRAIAA